MKLKKLYYWASDFKDNTGEGRLARLFTHELNNKYILIKISNPKILLLQHRYISPFVGIYYLWIYYLKKKNTLYINYLPYWNFLIFLLLPPNCKIGPITGGANYKINFKNLIIRKFIFSILYTLSSLILFFRFKYYIFSTDLLKEILPKYILKKSKFNYILNAIHKNKNTTQNKKIDFLIYYRNHPNKKKLFPFMFIKKLIRQNYKVQIVGDKLNFLGLKNHGYLTYSRVISLLKKTKYTIASNENIFSFFTIDAINNKVKILVDSKNYNLIKNFKDKFIKFNFDMNNLSKLK